MVALTLVKQQNSAFSLVLKPYLVSIGNEILEPVPAELVQ